MVLLKSRKIDKVQWDFKKASEMENMKGKLKSPPKKNIAY